MAVTKAKKTAQVEKLSKELKNVSNVVVATYTKMTVPQDYELRNMHAVAHLIARSALARRESRGAHFRSDYPEKQAAFAKHSLLTGSDEVRFV